MGFLSDFLKIIPNIVSGSAVGQPIGWGTNLIPIINRLQPGQMLSQNNPGPIETPAINKLPGIDKVIDTAKDIAGKAPTAETYPDVGGLGAPEPLPGGGYRVYNNKTGKFEYYGGAIDPNKPPGTANPVSPEAPDIGSLVFPKRNFDQNGIIANILKVMGGALPQGPLTENAPEGFGRFLRSIAANRFVA